MSKKRIDNRLEQLFTELNKEQKDIVQNRSKPEENSAVEPPHKSARAKKSAEPKTLAITTKTQDIPSYGETETITAPFQLDERSWATLRVVPEDETIIWDQEQKILVDQVASQLSLALENARLFQETQRQADELRVLNEMSRELSSLLDTTEIAETVYKHTSRLLDTNNFLLAQYKPIEKNLFLPVVILQGARHESVSRPLGKGLTEYIIRNKQPLLLNGDIVAQMKQMGIEFITIGNEDPALSWLGVPIQAGAQILGVIVLQSTEIPYLYNERHLELLQAIAAQVASAMENARLFQETERRNEELATLNKIISSASQSLDLNKILQQVLEESLHLLGFHAGLISLYDESAKRLSLNSWKNIPDGMINGIKSNGLGGTLCAHVYETNAPLAIVDIRESSPVEVTGVISNGLLSYLGVPLVARNQALGTLCTFNTHPTSIEPQQIELLESIARQIGFAIENAQLFQQMSQNQAQLSEALRIAKLSYFEIDRIARTIILTDEAYELLGTNIEKEKSYEVPIEQFTSQFMFSDDAQRILRAIRAVAEKPDNFQHTEIVRYIRRDGQVIWVELIFKLELDAEGIATKVISSAQDITQRQAAEEAIKRRNEYLAATAEIGRLVTSTLDLDTLFSRTVTLILEYFNYNHAAVFIISDSGLTAELREATGAAGEQMKKNKHSLPVGSKSVVGQATGTGTPIVINDTELDPTHRVNPLLPDTRAEAAVPLRIGERVIGVLDIQSMQANAFTEDDIAILQTLADQVAVAIENASSYELVQNSYEQLSEVDRVKSQFLANMSHELRTPLNSIIGFSRVILKGIDGPITELQQQDLTAIYSSGQHLLSLINDILDLSKIEAGKMELAFEEVNLAETVKSVMSTAIGLVKDKSVELKQAIDPNLPIFRADPMRIRQVLLNLISNAAKFTEEGSITVAAKLQAGTENQPEILVSVTDTGPGIAKEDQIKLFQPFSQVDDSPTRKTGGTGLGLSISSALVEMHGGHIDVTSEPGQGSTFFFTLPLQKPQIHIEDDAPVVLTIDDDKQIVELFERYLSPQGYRVISTNDPKQAVEKALQLKPYAITLDIMMPEMDGWQVLADLKANPETRNIPVIVCSILEEENKGFKLGAADYLVKPIMEENLLSAINHINAEGEISDILVIDDSPDDLRLISKMLETNGQYNVTTAQGGKAGWESIVKNHPQVIILDLFMPEMNGFTILEELHKTPELNNIPVIIVSGGDLNGEQQKQLNEYGQHLLQKGSLTESELLTYLEETLKQIKA